MPSFVTTYGNVAATDHYHLSISSSTIDEEHLQEIRPSLQQSFHPPRPPADNIFSFPPLLEFLSDQSHHRIMPPPIGSSDEEGTFDPISGVETEEFSDTVAAFSSPPKDQENTNQPDLTVQDEDSQSTQSYGNQNDDTIEVDTYSFDAIISEARAYYGDDKPEFCIKIPDHTTKSVLLSDTDTETEADLKLMTWDRSFGFWVLDDGAGDRYILKFQGGKYYVWQGTDKRWSTQAVAYPVQTSQKKAKKAKTTFARSNSTITSTRSGSLRTRTATQNKPYTTYNTRKKYENKGMSLSDAQLAEVMNRVPPARERKVSVNVRQREQEDMMDTKSTDNRSWSILSGTSDQITSLPSLSIPDDEKLKNTTLRTRFNGFDIATIPLPAYTCFSNDVFFTRIKRKWAFQLETRQIAYCVASFPWLKSDQNILLQETDNEGFLSVLAEIKRAPGWKKESTKEVVIQIYVK